MQTMPSWPGRPAGECRISSSFREPHGRAVVWVKYSERYVTLNVGTVTKPKSLGKHGQERTGMATRSAPPGRSVAWCRTVLAGGMPGAPSPPDGCGAYRAGPAGVSALSGGSPTDSIVTDLEPSLAMSANR